ncbi:hypothetical protein [Magnetofaba australis]|uniref:Uncharacterized protein n=1 Tax=Magnetofaba australis IT-1 TaxID=1434232 RepID=A0A1Y2K293_9PROT|nr:hypothetical protein [Magnetofaba australis]OSM00312.1 hypothetical protein MAIT1_00802 [Magnetofaba australis IT-1]
MSITQFEATLARKEIFLQLTDPELLDLEEKALNGELDDNEMRRLDRLLNMLYDRAMFSVGLI